MQALSELFDSTRLVVPCSTLRTQNGEIPITGHNISIAALTTPGGNGFRRKIRIPIWLLRNTPTLIRECIRADAVHAPIPGDVGTIGMLAAYFLRKPLFVRHCGNWSVQNTRAEHFWKWFMERFAGGRNVMLATGGNDAPPSYRNRAIQWIFSTTLSEEELKQNRGRQHPSRGRIRLVIACRQDRKKGTGVVIESLPLIMKDFPSVTLDVVGDGPALPEFRTQADRLGLRDRVIFHGKVTHERVLTILRQADIFCYPTAASEGFPKVVHEALACGLPVVSTKVSVLPQLLSDGCGVLLESATPTAVAQGVKQCLQDVTRYRAMSACSIETARQYSLERWRDTIGDLLRRSWGPLRADA